MPCLSDHHIYHVKSTGLKWFNANQPGLYNFTDFFRISSVTSILEQKRNNSYIAKVIIFFKVINNLVYVPHDHFFKSPISMHGHNLKFIQFAQI